MPTERSQPPKSEILHPSWEKALEEQREAAAQPERHEEAREALRERVREQVGRMPPAQAPPQAPAAVLVHPKADEIASMPEARQVVALANIAMTEGIEPAVALAHKIGSAYVMDAFHDALVDKLFSELIKRGKLDLE